MLRNETTSDEGMQSVLADTKSSSKWHKVNKWTKITQVKGMSQINPLASAVSQSLSYTGVD